MCHSQHVIVLPFNKIALLRLFLWRLRGTRDIHTNIKFLYLVTKIQMVPFSPLFSAKQFSCKIFFKNWYSQRFLVQKGLQKVNVQTTVSSQAQCF